MLNLFRNFKPKFPILSYEKLRNFSNNGKQKLNSQDLLIKEMAIDREQLSNQYTIRNLAIKGGGPKGIAYPSALEQLSKELDGLDKIERISGASAGSIMAALVAFGHTPQEISEFLKHKDEKNRPLLLQIALDGDDSVADEFVGKLMAIASNSRYPAVRLFLSALVHPFQAVKLGKKYYQQKGLCRGEFFESWLNDKIRDKIVSFLISVNDGRSKKDLEEVYQYPTFGQLNELTTRYGFKYFKHLYVTTAELILNNPGKAAYDVYCSESIPELESTTNIKYNSSLIIARTIRSSMSIPLFFTPVPLQILNEKNKKKDLEGSNTVDGGVLNNYPITVFDHNIFHSFPDIEIAPETKLDNPETIGLFLFNKQELTFRSWLMSQIKLIWNIKGDTVSVINPEKNPAFAIKPRALPEDKLLRHIMIDSCGVKLTDFDLSEDKIKALAKAGKNAVYNYKHSDATTLENTYTSNVKKRKESFKKYHNVFHEYTNLRNYSLCEYYQPPVQYDTILQQLQAVNNNNNALSLVGFGGTGKTELAKFVAIRYLEACIWLYWREKKLESPKPIVWIFDAENPKQLSKSFFELADKLIIDINKDNPCNHLNQVQNKLYEYPNLLWIFNNADFKQCLQPDTESYLHLNDYWSLRLPKNSWRIVTTRHRGADLTPIPHQIDLDKGMGDKAANALLEEITKLPNSDHITKALYHLPLNLFVAGKYICQQRRIKSNFNYHDYISTTGITHENDNQIVLKKSIEEIKQFPDKGKATYQLLWFCSLLNPDTIPYEMLITFIEVQQPTWDADTIRKALNDRLDLLLTYSLLGHVPMQEAQEFKAIYSVHRLIQSIVRKDDDIDHNLAIKCIRQYCAQQIKNIANKNKSQLFNLKQHLDTMANYYFDKTKYHETAFLFKEALKIQKAYYGDKNFETLGTLINLAHLYETSGEYCQAITTYHSILSIQEDDFMQKHHKANTLKHLSRLSVELGDRDSGEKFKKDAEALEKDIYKNHTPILNYPSSFFNNSNNSQKLAKLVTQLMEANTNYLFKIEANVLIIQLLGAEANASNLMELFEEILELRFNEQMKSFDIHQNQISISTKKPEYLSIIFKWFKDAKLISENMNDETNENTGNFAPYDKNYTK